MAQSSLFSSGIELATFVTSSYVAHRSLGVIMSCYEGIASNVGEGMSWKVYKEPHSGLVILAFEVTQDSSNRQVHLVSSHDLREKNFHHFDFLCTKEAPVFCVNSTAVSLLHENYEKLDQLKSEIGSSLPLIVTGHGVGGAIASLFTLLLLDSTGSGKKHPLCITFGSPLIGDKRLQEAISRSSTWSSCFLHVVSYKDLLPTKKLNPHPSAYMPFGTFLFCSDTSSTCFKNPESVLELLVSSINDQNQGFEATDYGKLVENFSRKAICKDFSAPAEDLTQSNSLYASTRLQLEALGLTPDMQQQLQNVDLKTLARKIETLERTIILPGRKTYDPTKKLNAMKINMAQLEWYKKDSKNRDIGYYDSYKNMNLQQDNDAVLYRRKLTQYWEKEVEEVEMRPQKEGAPFRTRWLYAGTNYRRMIEPLAIARYYREGGKHYETENRSKHFVQLEAWFKEEAEKATSNSNSSNKKNVESILTFDSCFWAHVEEALLSCKLLEGAQCSVTEKEEATRELLKFEKYVYGLLMKYEVSSEIFLRGSSYMAWWNQYEAIKGTSYNSPLKEFMSNPDYYKVHYAQGTYNFFPQASLWFNSVK